MNEKTTKRVTIFYPNDSKPQLLGTEFAQKPNCPKVCDECPLRAGELAVFGAVGEFEVPVGTKAFPGSIEEGLKRIDGETIGFIDESYPACFHPDRSERVQTKQPEIPTTDPQPAKPDKVERVLNFLNTIPYPSREFRP